MWRTINNIWLEIYDTNFLFLSFVSSIVVGSNGYIPARLKALWMTEFVAALHAKFQAVGKCCFVTRARADLAPVAIQRLLYLFLICKNIPTSNGCKMWVVWAGSPRNSIYAKYIDKYHTVVHCWICVVTKMITFPFQSYVLQLNLGVLLSERCSHLNTHGDLRKRFG